MSMRIEDIKEQMAIQHWVDLNKVAAAPMLAGRPFDLALAKRMWLVVLVMERLEGVYGISKNHLKQQMIDMAGQHDAAAEENMAMVEKAVERAFPLFEKYLDEMAKESGLIAKYGASADVN